MDNQQLLDPFPVLGVFLLFAIVALAAYEVGYRAGSWWQKRTPEEKEGPSSMLVGSVLALMAFLLAVTMGMASERFDARRQDVLLEANAIGTAYLRASYLPQPASDQSLELLREYAPLRIDIPDEAELVANFARSDQIQSELWTLVEPLARESPDSQVLALYISALNDVIDMGEIRLNAIVYARVPQTVVLLLFFGAALTLGMVGFHAGLLGRRGFIGALVLIVVLGAVITLVVDLDRPRSGFIEVSQQPLMDLEQQLEPARS